MQSNEVKITVVGIPQNERERKTLLRLVTMDRDHKKLWNRNPADWVNRFGVRPSQMRTKSSKPKRQHRHKKPSQSIAPKEGVSSIILATKALNEIKSVRDYVALEFGPDSPFAEEFSQNSSEPLQASFRNLEAVDVFNLFLPSQRAFATACKICPELHYLKNRDDLVLSINLTGWSPREKARIFRRYKNEAAAYVVPSFTYLPIRASSNNTSSLGEQKLIQAVSQVKSHATKQSSSSQPSPGSAQDPEVVIAIVDTGLHPSFRAWEYLSQQGPLELPDVDPLPDPWHPTDLHGSWVALRILEVAPQAKLIPCITQRWGYEELLRIYNILYLLAQRDNLKILVNNSWAPNASKSRQTLLELRRTTRERPSRLVQKVSSTQDRLSYFFAAGNSHSGDAGHCFPTSIYGLQVRDDVCTVGGCNADAVPGLAIEQAIYTQSSRGTSEQLTNQPIDKLWLQGFDDNNPQRELPLPPKPDVVGPVDSALGGTSSACARVTGIAYNLLQNNPTLTSTELYGQIRNLATCLGLPQTCQGRGRIDV